MKKTSLAIGLLLMATFLVTGCQEKDETKKDDNVMPVKMTAQEKDETKKDDNAMSAEMTTQGKDETKKDDNAMPAKMTAKLHVLSKDGLAEEVGTITVTDLSDKGISIAVKAHGIKSGEHGFHIHQKSDLSPLTKEDGSMVIGGMAGGHWDPDNTGVHSGPDGKGHRGDLPFLTVGEDGAIDVVIEVGRISYSDINGKSFMIHAGGDNYSDTPKSLGGGGARLYGAPFTK